MVLGFKLLLAQCREMLREKGFENKKVQTMLFALMSLHTVAQTK